MEAITVDTVDTLVTAVIVATEKPLSASAVLRADDLGCRMFHLVGNTASYTWVPVAEVAAPAWSIATATAVENARLALFDRADPHKLESDSELWKLLGDLGAALAFRTDRPIAANVERSVSSVRDVFGLPFLQPTPPTTEEL